MRRSLAKLAEKGGGDPEAVLARVTAVDGLVEADLLVEAVVEDASVKEAIFREADALLPPHAILASNTSSIPIGSLAAATSRPDRVIGMHFFNPVPVMRLVEVIRGAETSDETTAAIVALAEDLGKIPAEANDFPGFVSNRILMPFINEAVHALQDGVAEAEAIDTIATLGFAHPIGPLALADLIGLDTCVAIMDVLHEGLGDPKYAPCPLLREHVAAGPARPQERPRLLRLLIPWSADGLDPSGPLARTAATRDRSGGETLSARRRDGPSARSARLRANAGLRGSVGRAPPSDGVSRGCHP